MYYVLKKIVKGIDYYNCIVITFDVSGVKEASRLAIDGNVLFRLPWTCLLSSLVELLSTRSYCTQISSLSKSMV